MRHKIISLLLIAVSTILISCGNSNSTEVQQTNIQREVTLTDEESTELLSEITFFIEGSGTSKSLDMFAEDVTIDTDDKVNGLGVSDIKYYISGTAAYVQVQDYMYRFQLDNSNKVVSYIKYTVRA